MDLQLPRKLVGACSGLRVLRVTDDGEEFRVTGLGFTGSSTTWTTNTCGRIAILTSKRDLADRFTFL